MAYNFWGLENPLSLELSRPSLYGMKVNFYNESLHKDLKIPTVHQLAKSHKPNFHSKSSSHTKAIIKQISFISLQYNKLKRL